MVMGLLSERIEKYGLVEAAKLLFSNKYYIMISVTYIVQQTYSAMLNMGIYYMTYVLLNEDLYAVFSWAINIPLIIALIITPTLVAKWKGLYKLNIVGYAIATVGRALVVVAAYMHSVPLMILFTAVSSFGQGPCRVIWEQLWQTVLNILTLQKAKELMEPCIPVHLLEPNLAVESVLR